MDSTMYRNVSAVWTCGFWDTMRAVRHADYSTSHPSRAEITIKSQPSQTTARCSSSRTDWCKQMWSLNVTKRATVDVPWRKSRKLGKFRLWDKVQDRSTVGAIQLDCFSCFDRTPASDRTAPQRTTPEKMPHFFVFFCPRWPWHLTLTFQLGRDICTMHLNAKFHHPLRQPLFKIDFTLLRVLYYFFVAK